MVVYAGNWNRPCLDCGKTPADGAKFRGYPKPGNDRHYRKGSCKMLKLLAELEEKLDGHG